MVPRCRSSEAGNAKSRTLTIAAANKDFLDFSRLLLDVESAVAPFRDLLEVVDNAEEEGREREIMGEPLARRDGVGDGGAGRVDEIPDALDRDK